MILKRVPLWLIISFTILALTFAIAMFIIAQVVTLTKYQKAIACELRFGPDERTDEIVERCFTDNGLTPPVLSP